jgi:putative ABC transport system permease protein
MNALLVRLGLSGIRNRLGTTVLLAVLMIAGAATIMVALQIRSVADDPWDRTFRDTHGAHVLAEGPVGDLTRLASLPGVTEASGPIPFVRTTMTATGRQFGLDAVGLGVDPPSVQQPLVTDGRWIAGPGELVLERSFARAIGAAPGEQVSVRTTRGTETFTVAGVAVIAADEAYPETQPGQAFVAREDVARIQPSASGWRYIQALRLREPAEAPSFVADNIARFAPGAVRMEHWIGQRDEANHRNRVTSIVFATFSVIVLLAVTLVLATFVGARVLERHRQIALLKSVGLTPKQVASLFLVENLGIGLVGALAGAAIGTLLAPSLVRGSADLVGAVPVAIGTGRILLVVAIVESIVAAVTITLAIRIARFSTLHAIAAGSPGAASRGARRRRLGAPLPLTVGVKSALARPGRTAALVAALALSVGSLTATLAMESTIKHEDAVESASLRSFSPPPDPAGLAPDRFDPISAPDATREQIRPIVWGLDVLLLALVVANLLATLMLAVRERVRELGVLKAIGLTPRQVRASVLGGHALAGALAAIVGVPLGLGMFTGVYYLANGSAELVVLPPTWQLALAPPVAIAVVVAVTLIPARRAGRLPVVDALRYE